MNLRASVSNIFDHAYFLLHTNDSYNVARAYGDGAIFADAYKRSSLVTALKLAQYHIKNPSVSLLVNFPNMNGRAFSYKEGVSIPDFLGSIISETGRVHGVSKQDVLSALTYLTMALRENYFVIDDEVHMGKPTGSFDYIVERLALISQVYTQYVRGTEYPEHAEIPMRFEFNGFEYSVTKDTDVNALWATHQANMDAERNSRPEISVR